MLSYSVLSLIFCVLIYLQLATEEIVVKECIRRSPDTIDRRFCFDIVTSIDNSGHSSAINGSMGYSSNLSNGSHDNVTYTFQALSEEDYKLWLESLDGRDPVIPKPTNKQSFKLNDNGKSASITDSALSAEPSYPLDEEGYFFVRKCIQSIEARGLDQKGIYRIVGVASKVRNMMDMFAEKRQHSIAKRKDSTDSSGSVSSESDDCDLFELNLESEELETKTITSALKSYLRNLSEPLMTFQLHTAFISAASMFASILANTFTTCTKLFFIF